MTILLPRPINRYAFVSTYLFSSTAYGLIPISGPFIPTISKFHSSTPRKKGILIFGNHPSHSYVISFCAGVFSIAKRHAPDASASRMLQHLLHMAPYPPHVLQCDGDPMVEKFYGDLGRNSPAYFSHSYIYCSKILAVPLFASSTLKNQSEEPFHISVSSFSICS